MAARPPSLIDSLKGGKGALCNLVFLAGEVGPAETAGHRLEEQRAKEGRAFPELKTAHQETFALEATFRKSGSKLDLTAVPHIGHYGIFLGIWDVIDESAEAKVVRWYDEFHLPDVLACPGFVGAMRFRSLQRSEDFKGPRFLDLWLTDSNPSVAFKGIFKDGPWIGHPERLYPNADKVRRLLFVSPFVAQHR